MTWCFGWQDGMGLTKYLAPHRVLLFFLSLLNNCTLVIYRIKLNQRKDISTLKNLHGGKSKIESSDVDISILPDAYRDVNCIYIAGNVLEFLIFSLLYLFACTLLSVSVSCSSHSLSQQDAI